MLGAIADGETEITGFHLGADSLATLAAFRAMGVDIEGLEQGRVTIKGVGLDGLQPPASPLDMGNSGTAMRLMTGLLAGQTFASTLTGDASLSRRPMRRITDPLTRMGARIGATEAGTAPLEDHAGRRTDRPRLCAAGPQRSGQIQPAARRALQPGADLHHRAGPDPRPHRAHAARIRPTARGRRTTHLSPPGRATDCGADQRPRRHLLGGLLPGLCEHRPGSDLTLTNVGINPTRFGIITLLRSMGADIGIENERLLGGEPVADLRVRATQLRGIRIPEDQVPLAIDEFPALFIAAACAEGETVLTGAAELRVKESDRIAVMANGLTALGIDAVPTADGMRIRGGTPRAAPSTGKPATTASRWRSPRPRCAAPGQSRSATGSNVHTLLPGFVHAGGERRPRHRGALRMSSDEIIGNSRRWKIPVLTIDGPSGTGKGIDRRRAG